MASVSFILLKYTLKLAAADSDTEQGAPRNNHRYVVETAENGDAILPEYDGVLKQKALQSIMREFLTWHWRAYQFFY